MRAILSALAITALCVSAAGAEQRVRVHMTWGEEAPQAEPYYIKLVPATPGLQVAATGGVSLESGEQNHDGGWQTRAGAGDVDGIDFTLTAPDPKSATLQNMEVIWADLIANSDADTARRLGQDAAIHPQSPRLTVQMDPEGTRGFTVTLDQLLTAKAIWIPSLHVYLATGDDPVSFAAHKRQLAPWAGKRILEQVSREPEATYKEYTNRWEDMGDPAYVNPRPRGPGHIVGLTWDSAVPKFGIDRGAGVWNDYGNPDHFQFWFNFGDIAQGIIRTWKGQRLHDGAGQRLRDGHHLVVTVVTAVSATVFTGTTVQ